MEDKNCFKLTIPQENIWMVEQLNSDTNINNITGIFEINKLLDLTPKKVTILREQKEIEIPIEQVKVGDIIVVKPGETIAVDGVIVKGQTYIDESTITGEHIQ